MKRCGSCGLVKPLEEFHKNRRTKDGLMSICKPCNIAKTKAAYDKKLQKEGKQRRIKETLPEGYKRCSRCKEVKQCSAFYKNKTNKDGFSSACSSCSDEVVKLWVMQNPARRKTHNDSYHETHREEDRQRGRAYAASSIGKAKNRKWKADHPERTRELNRTSARKRRQENPELARAKDREWSRANPDKMKRKRDKRKQKEHDKPLEERYWNNLPAKTKEYRRNWRRANKNKVRVSKLRRKALHNKAAGTVTEDQLHARISFYGGLCWIPGCNKPYEAIDHVIPLSKGGTNWPSNLRPICKSHNSSKGAKHPLDFLHELKKRAA